VQIAHIYGAPMATESLPVGELSAALGDMVAQIEKGNMASVEKMLVSQAVALNVMFGEFARRASQNMGSHLDATESYTRMALKAQAQSANALRILAEVKNPKAPVAFVKQANITSGNQQVNNGPVMQGTAPTATSTHAHARTHGRTVGRDERTINGGRTWRDGIGLRSNGRRSPLQSNAGNHGRSPADRPLTPARLSHRRTPTNMVCVVANGSRCARA
jgi:hypothetical protein